MKPKKTNTVAITPTEAHRSLVADIEARACAEIRDDFAKLVITSAQLADSNVSLRQERDQLRAEVERADAFYRRACEVEHEMRAELASEVERLTNACNSFSNDEILQGSWKARAERAEAELTFQQERNSRLFEQRDAAVEAQGKAEAELAAERARLDWLDLRAPKCWGLIDAQMLAGKTETIRAAIDAAMQEGGK